MSKARPIGSTTVGLIAWAMAMLLAVLMPSAAALEAPSGNPGIGSVAEEQTLQQQILALDWLYDSYFRKSAAAPLSIRVTSTDRRVTRPGDAGSCELELDLAEDVKVFIDGKEKRITDLEAWMQVSLEVSEDPIQVTTIKAKALLQGPDLVVKAVHPGKGKDGVISIEMGSHGTLKDLPVAQDVKIEISPDWDEPRTLGDLRPGMRCSFTLGTENGEIVLKSISAVPARR